MAGKYLLDTNIIIAIFKRDTHVLQQFGCAEEIFVPAIARISSVIFIEQYFGPHMLQKWALLKVSAGRVASW